MAGKRVSMTTLNNSEALDTNSASTSMPIASVVSDPENPRRHLRDLDSLAESIRAHGQLEPVTVVAAHLYLKLYPEHKDTVGNAKYVIIMGQRRYRAILLAGLKTIEIAVKNSLADSKETLLAAAIAENDDREGFRPIEQAIAYQKLVDQLGVTGAAKKRGKHKGFISNRIVLLKLVEDLQNLVDEGEMPIRDAREIARLDPDLQITAWEDRKASKAAPKAPRSVQSQTPGDTVLPAGNTPPQVEDNPGAHLKVSAEIAPEPQPPVSAPAHVEQADSKPATTVKVPPQQTATPSSSSEEPELVDASTVGEPAGQETSDFGVDLVEVLGTTPPRIASTLKQLLPPGDYEQLAKILSAEVTVRQQ